MKIEKAEANQYGRRLIRIESKPPPPERKIFNPDNPCVVCKVREITIMYADCGHICCCEECEEEYCQVCHRPNT